MPYAAWAWARGVLPRPMLATANTRAAKRKIKADLFFLTINLLMHLNLIFTWL
jgi:hypothetical protein